MEDMKAVPVEEMMTVPVEEMMAVPVWGFVLTLFHFERQRCCIKCD